jgi:outer membrane biosynthesis protein TonB
MKAVKNWQFVAAKKNNQFIASKVQVPINFILE